MRKMPNVVASDDYTYVLFQPTETGSVEHSDQEYTDSSSNSFLYRTYNAQFDKTLKIWHTLTSGVSEAYATVQNPDGSIHYYSNYNQATNTFESTWAAWFGSGNNAVFNGVDYGMVADTGLDNTVPLQNVINAALDAGGGEVRLPPGTYKISGVINLSFGGVPGNDPGIIIRGVSGKAEIAQQSITSDVFSVSGLNSGRGVRFEDLRITYATPNDPQTVLAAAVRVTNSQNVTCERMYFNNCPQAFYTDSNGSGLFDCTITYDNFALGGSGTVAPTMVYLGGSENYIDSCIMSQQPRNADSPGPVGCIGVVIDPGGGAYFITNTHISDFTQGIVVSGSSVNINRVFCSNVICESWSNSLVLQPTGTQTLQQVYCDDCLFAKSGGSDDTSSIGVVIGTSGANNSTVGELFLNNCMCINWDVAGVQVNAGQKIVITGGRYGSNAYSTTTTVTSGGITLAGGADVTINGADLTPKVTNPVFPTQSYAIAITAAVGGLYVRGCSMTGYAPNSPLYLSSAGTNIQITDCAGYNDVYAVLTSTTPTSGHAFTAAADYSYFGPVTFYVGSGASLTLHIETHSIPIATGAFTLGPGESAQLNYMSSSGPPVVLPPAFLMIGN